MTRDGAEQLRPTPDGSASACGHLNSRRLVKQFGRQWWLHANRSEVGTYGVTHSDPTNFAGELRAINDGQVDGGVIYHYYWVRDQAKTKEISGNTALHYFRNEDPGAFVSISGGGILNSSKKKDEAQRFLTFITGKAGQEVLENGTSFEYPVGSGVPANKALVPLDQLQAPAVNPSNLDSQQVTDLMTKAGLL